MLNHALFRWGMFLAAVVTLTVLMCLPVPDRIGKIVQGRDKVLHLAAFAALSWLLAWALSVWPRLKALRCAALAGSCVLLYGCATEGAQHLVPGRVADMVDCGANGLGAVLGAGLFLLLTFLFGRAEARGEEPESAKTEPGRRRFGRTTLLMLAILAFWLAMMGILGHRHYKRLRSTTLKVEYDQLLPEDVNRLERRMGIWFQEKRFGTAHMVVEKRPDEIEIRNVISINAEQIPRMFRFYPTDLVIEFEATFAPLRGLQLISIKSPQTSLSLIGKVEQGNLVLSGSFAGKRINEVIPFEQESLLSDMLSPLQGLPELRRSDVGRQWTVTLINPLNGQPQSVDIRVHQLVRQRVRIDRPNLYMAEFRAADGEPVSVLLSRDGRLLALENVPALIQYDIGRHWPFVQPDPETGQKQKRRVDVRRLVRWEEEGERRNGFVIAFSERVPPAKVWITDDGRLLPMRKVTELTTEDVGKDWTVLVPDRPSEPDVRLTAKVTNLIERPTETREMEIFILRFQTANAMWDSWVTPDGEVLQQGTPFSIVLRRDGYTFLERVATIKQAARQEKGEE